MLLKNKHLSFYLKLHILFTQIVRLVEIKLNIIYLLLHVLILLAFTIFSPCRGFKGYAGLLDYSSV